MARKRYSPEQIIVMLRESGMIPGLMPPPPEKPGTGMTFNELRDYAAKQRREREDY
jgi:hypothetical protein